MYIYIYIHTGVVDVCVCVCWLSACIFRWFCLRQAHECNAAKSASAGNRTRVTSMATMYSTTRPLMQLECWFGCLVVWVGRRLVPASHTELRVFWQRVAAVACTHICIHKYIYIYKYKNICIYIYIYIYMYARVEMR